MPILSVPPSGSFLVPVAIKNRAEVVKNPNELDHLVN